MLTIPAIGPNNLEIRKVVFDISGIRDALDTARAVVCVPVIACYGRPSLWVVSIDGSPPRGTLMLRTDHFFGKSGKVEIAVFFDNHKSRTLNHSNKHLQAINRFFDQYIGPRSGLDAVPFQIHGNEPGPSRHDNRRIRLEEEAKNRATIS